MSKISYCSLEEAWGTSLNKKEDKYRKNQEKTEKINNNEKDYEELNAFKSKSQIDYESLKEDNEKMKKIINTMNLVERNKTPENNINDDYNKYRFNPINQVNGLYNTNDYKPFQDDIEKKSLQDRFVELENEFRKYKMLMNTKNNNLNEEESIESFMNFNNQNNTDIQDLIVLIVLGLIIIFIMDNIFKLGKYMGSKN